MYKLQKLLFCISIIWSSIIASRSTATENGTIDTCLRAAIKIQYLSYAKPLIAKHIVDARIPSFQGLEITDTMIEQLLHAQLLYKTALVKMPAMHSLLKIFSKKSRKGEEEIETRLVALLTQHNVFSVQQATDLVLFKIAKNPVTLMVNDEINRTLKELRKLHRLLDGLVLSTYDRTKAASFLNPAYDHVRQLLTDLNATYHGLRSLSYRPGFLDSPDNISYQLNDLRKLSAQLTKDLPHAAELVRSSPEKDDALLAAREYEEILFAGKKILIEESCSGSTPDCIQNPLKIVSRDKSKVTMEDVAGLADVKKEISSQIVFPFENPQLAKMYGVRVGGGILMYGPPGNGKTLIAKAIAGSINAEFRAISGADIHSKWVGESEQRIAKTFADARNIARSGKRVVIFLDEVDSLIPDRNLQGDGSASQSSRSQVNQFLTELDGFGSNNENILLLAATNAPWLLDKAFMRPGRIDDAIYVPLPDAMSIAAIIKTKISQRPNDLKNEELLSAFAEELARKGYSGAEVTGIVERAAKTAFEETVAKRTGNTSSDFVAPISLEILRKVAEDSPPKTDRELISRLKNWGLERISGN